MKGSRWKPGGVVLQGTVILSFGVVEMRRSRPFALPIPSFTLESGTYADGEPLVRNTLRGEKPYFRGLGTLGTQAY